MVGYFEEQAVISYTEYLKQIDNGSTKNIQKLWILWFEKTN